MRRPRVHHVVRPRGSNPFHVVTIRLAYRPETWDFVEENRGSYYWEGGAPTDWTTKEPKGILDFTGNPIEVPLADDGDLTQTDAKTFKRICYLREMDFNNIGICIDQGVPSQSQ